MHRLSRTVLSAALVLTLVAVASPAVASSAATAKHPAGPVDVNNASVAQLESLPGVGPSTANKIVAGRPYTSMDDLKAKTHMPEATVAKLNGMVTFGTPGTAGAASAPAAAPAASSHASTGKSHAAAPTGPIDINTASAAQLESIHGVGPATANKIIAGRPYSSTADLAKLHLPKNQMDQIMPNVTASAVAAAPAAQGAPAAAPTPSAAPAASSAPAHASHGAHSSQPKTEAQVPPVQGMVWVNLDTKVYHVQGDQWYGRTKNGKFMTEQDAVAAGYRPAKKGGHHEGGKEHDKDHEHDGDHGHDDHGQR